MCYSFVICLSLLQPAEIQTGFVALFEPREIRYTGGEYKDQVFRYRLFVPPSSDADERFPLIVWLHGLGDRGIDNVRQLKWVSELFMPPPWEPERYPFAIVAAQCPVDNSFWTRYGGAIGSDSDMTDVLAKILDETLQSEPIDPERVYLVGVSSGGTGCWRMAIEYPEYFAAMAPLGSHGVRTDRLQPMAGIPVWAFHNDEDTSIAIQHVRESIGYLREQGATAWLTVPQSTRHDCWTTAFQEYQLLDWLFAQRKGGQIWQWWQVLLQGCLFAAIGGLGWAGFRLRRRLAERPRPDGDGQTGAAAGHQARRDSNQ